MLIVDQLPTPMVVAGVGFSRKFVCLSAYPHDVSKTNAPILTCSPGSPFILGSKGHRSRPRVTKTVPAWSMHSCECWLLLVLLFAVN